MLDDLYVDVKKRVTDLLVSCSKHGIVALVLDGWENVNRSHVVHILCMSGGATIFLDSVGTGVESQTAEHQAALAQELMDAKAAPTGPQPWQLMVPNRAPRCGRPCLTSFQVMSRLETKPTLRTSCLGTF
jgi:hypothetical protein